MCSERHTNAQSVIFFVSPLRLPVSPGVLGFYDMTSLSMHSKAIFFLIALSFGQPTPYSYTYPEPPYPDTHTNIPNYPSSSQQPCTSPHIETVQLLWQPHTAAYYSLSEFKRGSISDDVTASVSHSNPDHDSFRVASRGLVFACVCA